MRLLYFLVLFFILTIPSFAKELDGDEIFDIKQNAFALYNTNHLDEAKKILEQIPYTKRDEEVYLILANIEEDKGNSTEAYSNLRKSIEKNPKFYKAYYNLGCIYMKRKVYVLAIDNFMIALKNEEKNPFIYYNLGCAQMNMGEYKEAKKNFVKAIYLKNDERDFYYNLAYVNKKLGKEKESKKVIDFYNANFVK